MTSEENNEKFSKIIYFIEELILMNLLWIVFSLPIVTIGASTTALYNAYMKKINQEDGFIWRNFFSTFRRSLKRTIKIWVALLILGIVLFLDISIGLKTAGALGKFMVISCSLLSVPYLMILTYIFPVEAIFKNTIKANLKAALFISILNIGFTLLIFFYIFSVIVLCKLYWPFILLIIICGFSAYGYLTSNLFVHIFCKFLK